MGFGHTLQRIDFKVKVCFWPFFSPAWPMNLCGCTCSNLFKWWVPNFWSNRDQAFWRMICKITEMQTHKEFEPFVFYVKSYLAKRSFHEKTDKFSAYDDQKFKFWQSLTAYLKRLLWLSNSSYSISLISILFWIISLLE